MTPWRCLMWVGLVAAVGGCAVFEAKESRYLRTAQDRATQEEVREQLGPPLRTASTPAGDSQWVYEVRDIEAGSQNSRASTGSWCDEYVLTFDAGGVLRRWTHASYLHGGEMMPDRCDSGVRKPAL
ncbi:MAG: hypothetical protein FJ249_06920 [Nitrospira sp.]|nr:hypothetical protein [Nitrospira sp.]